MAENPRDRFWKFVTKTDGCWTWNGWKGGSGYGRFAITEKVKVPAHRFAYEDLIGSIPEGLQIDHLCRNKPCVNPAHLEPVTCSENVKRGTSGIASKRRALLITHCPNGHEYSAENSYGRPGRNERDCKICRKQRSLKWRRENGISEHERLVIDGESKSVAEWADIVGIHRTTINKRIAKGWNQKDAVFTPSRKWRK